MVIAPSSDILAQVGVIENEFGSVAIDEVLPSPATHAILRPLKAGESVFQTVLLTKTVVHALQLIE